jgi:hypothetical protein
LGLATGQFSRQICPAGKIRSGDRDIDFRAAFTGSQTWIPPVLSNATAQSFRAVKKKRNEGVLRNVLGNVFLRVIRPDISEHIRIDLSVVSALAPVQVPVILLKG